MKLNTLRTYLFCLSALMSSCGKSTQTAQTTLSSVSPDTDFVEVVRGRTMDEVTVEEVERLYYNNGGYDFNVAGYDFTFAEYLRYNPATMRYPFDALQHADENPIYIEQTPDGRIRAYNWCSYAYGSNVTWNHLIQIEDNGTVYVPDEIPDWDMEVSTIEHIYQLPEPGYYIFVYYLREWASMGHYAAVGYQLNGHTLKRVRLFTDTDATHRDRLELECNTSDFYFRIGRAIGGDDFFYYDEQNATLYYPRTRIRYDETLLVSDRYIPYVWDGTGMTEDEETGNPRLHPSLQDYAYVDRIARFNNADSVIARIDVLPDGSYRYASWINEPMTAEPAMVLHHGTEDDQRYYFRNETHTYVITKDDCPVLEIYDSVNPYVQH